MMDTILNVIAVSSIGIVVILAAGLHSLFLQARLKQVRSRNARHHHGHARRPH